MKHILVSLISLLCGTLFAAPIGFLEDFVLSEDREATLRQLVPGTDDYYYYSALHHQLNADKAAYMEVMRTWQSRTAQQRRADPDLMRELKNRQALLGFELDPKAAYARIVKDSGLRFEHSRRVYRKPNYPTSLDPATITGEAFQKRLNVKNPNYINSFTAPGLDRLQGATLTVDQRRALLHRLTHPNWPGLVDLIVADLKAANSQGFGSHPIHNNLTLPQMSDLAAKHKVLLDMDSFVNAYIVRLAPGADVELEADLAAKAAYFERVEAFVKPLNPVHNSLKLNLLHQQLQHDLKRGAPDPKRFMEYIKIPRALGYMRPEYLKAAEFKNRFANLNQGFGAPFLSPVRGDEALIREYLERFFVDAKDYKIYSPYLRDSFLKEIFASTKILNGIGDVEKWASELTPANYRTLKEAIEINFHPDNPDYWNASEKVRLSVDLKNVPSLRVKVYEINAFNYYREMGQEVNLAINLDGLVAAKEKSYTYDNPPERRVAHDFDFPELKGRGTWVVEFIGNGMSSRALVRKGRLFVDQAITAAGHGFRVLDETGKAVKPFSVWVGGRAFEMGKDGIALVPFSTSPSQATAVLQHGDMAGLVRFSHQAESYDLDCKMHVDRESLLRGKSSEVLLRPVLRLNGIQVNPAILENVRLQIRSTDLHGTPSERTIPGLVFALDEDLVVPFTVPEHIVSLSLDVLAEVRNVSRDTDETLSSVKRYDFSLIEQGTQIDSVLLSRRGDIHVVEIRGKNGEAKADRVLHLRVLHDDFTEAYHTTVQTDIEGVCVLGALPAIRSVQIEYPGQQTATLVPEKPIEEWSSVIHGFSEEPTLAPCSLASTEAISLFAGRQNAYTEDLSDTLKLNTGLLRIPGLPGGNYELVFTDLNKTITVRISDGKTRKLEFNRPLPMQIAGIAEQGDDVLVKIHNPTAQTRVHVFATWYQPAHSPSDLFGYGLPAPSVQQLTPVRSFYESGRDIGDEYRYILERQKLPHYPDNMLTRPGLLLNPWVLQTTSATDKQAGAGGMYADAAEEMMAAPRRSAALQQSLSRGGGRASAWQEHANLDFLAQASVRLFNLKPDAEGLLRIPIADLNGKPQIHVVAVDLKGTAYRPYYLNEGKMELADIRLERALDPAKGYAQQKMVTMGNANDTLTIRGGLTAKYEVYDSITDVFGLMRTLSQNSTLTEFEFITTWPSLKAEEKQSTYSKFACHELSFFLYHKDPAFFKSVILPHLTNKKDKTFLDHWLLSDDLTRFVEPWNFQRLNHVEKILLAQRVGDQEGPVQRWIQDLRDMVPPTVEADQNRFRAALKNNALSDSPAWAGASLESKLERQSAGGERKSKAKADSFAFGGGASVGGMMMDQIAPAASAPAVLAKKGMKSQAKESQLSELMEEESDMFAGRRLNEAAKRVDALSLDGLVRSSRIADRELLRRFFVKLEKTKEYAENNYWHLPIASQTGGLIPINRFWNDYAAHDGKSVFLSKHLDEATSCFAEMMLALAVLELPFDGDAVKDATAEKGDILLELQRPAILFHEEIRPGAEEENPTPILVAQNFFRANDRYRHENNEQLDKFVTGEFLKEVVYGCQVILTNPNSNRQKLDVLLQIPKGAIPVNRGFETKGQHYSLSPFETQKVEYFFYFPQSGDAPHLPVNVARNEKLVAKADPVTLKVVDKLSTIDTASWEYISQNGTLQEVLGYLGETNLNRLKLDDVAWRCRDKAGFDQLIGLLSNRLHYHHTLWSYAIYHQNDELASDWLQHDGFPNRCGLYLDTPLLQIDPVARHRYQHLEYDPLVNKRAHQLGRERDIANHRLHTQYHELLKVLSYRSELDDTDQLALTYYLSLQDRIEESLARFKQVDRDKVATPMQYDYMAAWLAFFEEDLATARRIATQYESYPVDRWQARFRNILNQLDEDIAIADKDNRDQNQDLLAGTEPVIHVSTEDRDVKVDHQNLKGGKVNIYPMDIELLFSRNPFVKDQTTTFTFVRPSFSQDLPFGEGEDQTRFPVPQSYRNQNIMVEVVSGGLRDAAALYANDLTVNVVEAYGQVQVLHRDSRKALSRSYVKVYARMKNGEVAFFKDGYTDFRGRFDFVSLNTTELAEVERFSILVMHDEFGATILEAEPPKQ